MSVYVDDAQIPFGRMVMSHLMADDVDELHEFARRLGLKRTWFQDKSVPHYDVSEGKRQQALRMGAIAEDCMNPSDALRAAKRAHRARARRP